MKVGDLVTQYLSSARIPRLMRVVYEDRDHVWVCLPDQTWPQDECWKFRRDTLAEVDERFGWDGVKVTGSVISPEIIQ